MVNAKLAQGWARRLERFERCRANSDVFLGSQAVFIYGSAAQVFIKAPCPMIENPSENMFYMMINPGGVPAA